MRFLLDYIGSLVKGMDKEMAKNTGDPFMKPLNKRQKKILKAMWKLGGIEKGVIARHIAYRTGLNPIGICQTLRRLPAEVDCLGGKGADTMWKLKNCYAGTL